MCWWFLGIRFFLQQYWVFGYRLHVALLTRKAADGNSLPVQPQDSLEIIQPAVLNKYVDDSIPLRWKKRWETLRLLAPLVVVAVLFQVEVILLTGMFEGAPAVGARLLASIIGLPAAFLGIAELSIRQTHWSRRKLRLDRKGVSWSHGNSSARWKWEWVKAFVFSEIAGEKETRKLTVRVQARKRTFEKSLVISGADEVSKAEKFLENRKLVNAPFYEVVHRPEEPFKTKDAKPARDLVSGTRFFPNLEWSVVHGSELSKELRKQRFSKA